MQLTVYLLLIKNWVSQMRCLHRLLSLAACVVQVQAHNRLALRFPRCRSSASANVSFGGEGQAGGTNENGHPRYPVCRLLSNRDSGGSHPGPRKRSFGQGGGIRGLSETGRVSDALRC